MFMKRHITDGLHAIPRSSGPGDSCLCMRTHFAQSNRAPETNQATPGIAIPVRPDPEVPAAQ